MGWLNDIFGSNEQEANRQRTGLGLRGANLLAPSTADFQGQFGALQALSAPMLNQIAASQDLAGQQAAYGIQSSLGRAGLGSTGLGTALASGAQAGAAFQGNVLRARILQDLLGQTSQIQQARGSLVAGIPIQAQQFTGAQGLVNTIGQGIQSYASARTGGK